MLAVLRVLEHTSALTKVLLHEFDTTRADSARGFPQLAVRVSEAFAVHPTVEAFSELADEDVLERLERVGRLWLCVNHVRLNLIKAGRKRI